MKLSYGEAQEALKFSNSYTRLGNLIDLASKMERKEWLKLLGEEWSGCDNIAQYRLLLKRILPQDTMPILEMMTDEEQAALDALPDTITLFRGCGNHNKVGASWTLDRGIAEKFPFLNRYRVKNPLLVTARIKKENVIAYKMDREEHEIITFSARRIKTEPITEPPVMERPNWKNWVKSNCEPHGGATND